MGNVSDGLTDELAEMDPWVSRSTSPAILTQSTVFLCDQNAPSSDDEITYRNVLFGFVSNAWSHDATCSKGLAGKKR
jgi:hypothetical protein